MLKQGSVQRDPAFRVDGQGVIDAEGRDLLLRREPRRHHGHACSRRSRPTSRSSTSTCRPSTSRCCSSAPRRSSSSRLLVSFVNPDPMEQAIGLGLNHELWVRGEPAGYANHVTGRPLRPLPGSIPKKMLVTVALLDQQVSNLGSQLLGRTLRPRHARGLGDARARRHARHDAGRRTRRTSSTTRAPSTSTNPAHRPFIPPLVNQPAERATAATRTAARLHPGVARSADRLLHARRTDRELLRRRRLRRVGAERGPERRRCEPCDPLPLSRPKPASAPRAFSLAGRGVIGYPVPVPEVMAWSMSFAMTS